MEKALISGINGQDGSYLAELLLSKNYEVHGIIRHTATENKEHRFSRINHILDRITLHYADITNYASICKVVQKVQPDEFYHLAAMSFVAVSFEDYFTTLNVNVNGTLHVLSAIKEFAPKCKVYNATSSEMMGKVLEIPQTEKTPFYPRSVYGISKVASFDLARNFREAYNLFISNGILYNHESPKRGIEFVTRKITNAVARIKLGKQDKLYLGNIDAKRDWGFSGDYCLAMWLILQQEKPDDFVIATNEVHSIKEFLEEAFSYVNLNWKDYVVIDEKFKRPSDVDLLIGDYSKAKRILGWGPKIRFKKLVRLMVDHDLQAQL